MLKIESFLESGLSIGLREFDLIKELGVPNWEDKALISLGVFSPHFPCE